VVWGAIVAILALCAAVGVASFRFGRKRGAQELATFYEAATKQAIEHDRARARDRRTKTVRLAQVQLEQDSREQPSVKDSLLLIDEAKKWRR